MHCGWHSVLLHASHHYFHLTGTYSCIWPVTKPSSKSDETWICTSSQETSWYECVVVTFNVILIKTYIYHNHYKHSLSSSLWPTFIIIIPIYIHHCHHHYHSSLSSPLSLTFVIIIISCIITFITIYIHHHYHYNSSSSPSSFQLL